MTYQQNIDVTAATIAAPVVTFDRAPLFAALEYINKHIVERRNTYSILANVLIEATSDGMARLIATDLDLEAVITIPANWAMPGAFTVSAATLRDIVKIAAKSAQIAMEYQPGERSPFNSQEPLNYVAVKIGRNVQRLTTAPREDFPRIVAADLPLSWECDAATLAADIALLSPAISKEEARYYLNGIFVHARGDGMICMAATDGHAMSTTARPAPIPAMQWDGVIMPRKAVAAMAAAIKGQESAALAFSASKFRVSAGNIELYAKLIDGTFPDYARFIPNAAHLTGALAVTGSELVAHCKMAAKGFAQSRPLMIELSESGCRAGQSTHANPLSAEYAGNDCTIQFGAQYLEPMAKAFDRLDIQGAAFDDGKDLCPMLFTSPDAPHWTGVLMTDRCNKALPAPLAPRYIETMPAPGQAADLFGIEKASSHSSRFGDNTESLGLNPGARKATGKEIEAYARDYAARLGHAEAAANWTFSIAKTNADGQVVAVEFDAGHSDNCNRFTIILPGYGQDKQPVTVEIMDDAGDYAAPMACTDAKGRIAMPDQPKGRAKAKAKIAKPRAAKAIKSAAAPAPDPISEPATVNPLSAENVIEDGRGNVWLLRENGDDVVLFDAVIGKRRGEYATIESSGAVWIHDAGGCQTLVHDRTGTAMNGARNYAKEMHDSAESLLAEFAVTRAAIEAAQETPAAPEKTPVVASPVATSSPIDAQSYAIAALIARVEALESAIERQATPPSSEIADFAPLPHDPRALSIIRGKQEIAADDTLSVQSKPKRAAAHVRAIIGYLALRRERKHNAIGMQQLDAMRTERDQLQKSLETVQADSIRWQQQDAAREKADYAKRRRAVIAARTRSQAALQLGKALVASIAECERLKRVAYQQAGHIVNVAERLDRAEMQLRKHGPALTIVPPITLAVPVAA